MKLTRWASIAVVFLFLVAGVYSQETTGGLQGTVKDPTGAVVAGAHITLTGTALTGSKSLETDSSGYYRFTNLSPGIYEMDVTATGFSTLKQGNIEVEVGHTPTMDLAM